MAIFEHLPIEGLVLVRLTVHGDERGFFMERYRRSEYANGGLPLDVCQENHSRSAPGVLRGLHYQHTPPQGKLVGVSRGRIWDVAVDLRPHSESFGKSYACELTGANGLELWVPPGFGHGFVVLGDQPADVLYKTTAEYDPTGEAGIAWDDPELAIEWPVDSPVLSERDRELQSFADYRKAPPSWKMS